MIALKSDDPNIDYAFKIAIGDIFTNIAPYWTTLHSRPYNGSIDLIAADADILNAGLDYPTPWTRDAAINTWNGAGLFLPEITRNTLLSALEKKDGKIILRDEYESQYWDAIIWVIGAWEQFLYTSDTAFLETALEATENALTFFETTEFDAKRGLFRGPASTSDGVSGYPDFYADTNLSGMHGGAFILDWLDTHPEHRVKTGRGMPMFALSTNCLYFRAYEIVGQMAAALNKNVSGQWHIKAEQLKQAINNNFWSDKLGYYKYMVDNFSDCDRQECLGHAYAMAFGIADSDKAKSLLEKQTTLSTGIPVLWPQFDRYRDDTGQSVGRHCGCIWPPFEAMFTLAAKKNGRNDLFLRQITNLAKYACRDLHFAEIYHPLTGGVYGGIQEFRNNKKYLWKSCSRQTWSATCFVRLILRGLAGIELSRDGMRFDPVISGAISFISVSGIMYNKMNLNIHINGPGEKIETFMINGKKSKEPLLASDGNGKMEIEIKLSQ